MFEAYKIGVKISVINHASLGLAMLSKSFLKTEADAAKLQARIASIQQMALKGALYAGMGTAGLSLLKGPYEEAKKLAQARADFETMNLSAHDNARARAQAATLAQRNLGTSITHNLKQIHDLHTAFGDLPHALRTAEDFAKFNFIARVVNGGQEVDGLVYNAAKALEHRGQKVMGDPAQFRAELERQAGVYLGSKGKVGPSEFFHASQTGKMAYTLMSRDELYGPFAAYVQAKSGATAGTAAMTFASSLIGGHMTSKAKGFLADLGLWEEGVSRMRMKSISRALGGVQGKDLPSALKNMGILAPLAGGLKSEYLDLAVHHQSRFVQQVLVPAIRKRYGMNLSDEAVAALLMKHFNRNTADFMGEYVVNAMKFSKDAAIFKNSMGIGEAYRHYLHTPVGAEIAAGEAYRNVKAVLGTMLLPVILQGLLALAKGLTVLSDFFARHTSLAKGLTLALTTLAGGLAIRGTVWLLAAAFRGLGLAMRYGALGGILQARSILGRYAVSAPLTAIGKRFSRLFGLIFGALSTPFQLALTRLMTPLMTRLGRLVIWGLRAIPILGWAVMGVTLGIWLWRNWAVVGEKARAIWGVASKYMVGAWEWVSHHTLLVWRSLKGALSMAFKTFAGWFLDQWQALFNGVLSGVNHLLPKAFALKPMTFAEDYRRSPVYPNPRDPQRLATMTVAPPIQVQTTLQLDGRQIAQAVTRHQAQAAQRAAFASGSQPDGSLYLYSPAQP